ncbi:hypothetical protein K505DRAFT_397962 [Melanomma pulvis-pyrius CBS 109.77]|uniref:Aminoglycoside phosphotransferase domain-containing protein n=1 Tax=Melanomma pulvis-pyrius CBS 109.77 TaxID=1314802 RepID=A0A6A6XN31_9PLEO|nr:hypothetical protein K505DRAFT_397962 [Melanomma pulvis-pyrius CBS 109.77]
MTSKPIHEKGELESLTPLPLEIDQMTPEWFASILKLPVIRAKVIEIIHGTASKILYQLSQRRPTSRAALRLPGLVGSYRREAEFYYYLALLLSIRLPKCLYAGTTKDQGLLVLEDLIATHHTFGSPIDTWPLERVGAGLAQLASLHGTTSGTKLMQTYPWAVPQLREIILNMVSEGEWNKRFAPETAPPVPESQMNRPRIEAAFKTLWKQTPVLTTVIHADCHCGNTYLNSRGEPGFLDWQGPPLDRRENERALLSQYLEVLHVAGGPKLTVEDVWKEYQYQHVHGFVWPLSGPLMQPREIVDEMSRRHCTAIEDHKSLEILEGLPNHIKVG